MPDCEETFEELLAADKANLRPMRGSPDYELVKLAKRVIRHATEYENKCAVSQDWNVPPNDEEARLDREANAAGWRLFRSKGELEDAVIRTLAGAQAFALAARHAILPFGQHEVDLMPLLVFLSSTECARQIATASAKGT